jgi:acyl carrier protein
MAASLGRRDRARFEQLGIGAIGRDDGGDLFQQLLASDAAQVVVLPVDWQKFASASPAGRPPALIADLIAPTPPPSAVTAPLVQRLADAPVKSRAAVVQSYVREVVYRVLGMPANAIVESTQPLRAMGLDSLMAVELRNHLQTGVGRPLPSTLAFDCPTVGALADHLSRLLDDAPTAATSVAMTSTPTEAVDALLELSDEEAEALLAEELNK